MQNRHAAYLIMNQTVQTIQQPMQTSLSSKKQQYTKIQNAYPALVNLLDSFVIVRHYEVRLQRYQDRILSTSPPELFKLTRILNLC